MLYLFIALSILSNVIANVSLKIGAGRLDGFNFHEPAQAIIKIFTDVPLVMGAAFFVFSFVCYIYVLNYVNLSIFYPVSASLGISLIAIISVFFLHESLHLMQIVGIAVIVFGVWLVSHK
jgi:multidrug transporter EmrE-like cation transporter